MTVHYDAHGVTLHHGDCLDILATLPDASVDAVVTDPPYGLEFMGKEWDKFGAVVETASEGQDVSHPFRDGTQRVRFGNGPAASAAFGQWCTLWAAECLRVLKPGGHLLAFGGTRTWHRLACAIEDAGFDIRDSIAWMYGSGFPKSLDVSKAIDKAAGATREKVAAQFRASTGRAEQGSGGYAFGEEFDITAPATPEAARWAGWGTALKPAHEPIVVARKPLAGTVSANVLAHGTGALNIDGCRIEGDVPSTTGTGFSTEKFAGQVGRGEPTMRGVGWTPQASGRWPANVVLDESQAAALDAQSGERTSGLMRAGITPKGERNTYAADAAGGYVREADTYGDTGGASRFLYVAKADADERPRVNGMAHATVKPIALMRWLVRLVTPPGGVVLEPFAGSGTTAEACLLEGFRCIAIEREADYLPLIVARITRQRDPVAHVQLVGNDDTPTLFDHL